MVGYDRQGSWAASRPLHGGRYMNATVDMDFTRPTESLRQSPNGPSDLFARRASPRTYALPLTDGCQRSVGKHADVDNSNGRPTGIAADAALRSRSERLAP